MTRELVIREPIPSDEEQVMIAHAELAKEGFNFALLGAHEEWENYLTRIKREAQGVGLEPGQVPATMLFGWVGPELAGRVHIRHELTPELLKVNGNIGYGVRPSYRRRGVATEMLRRGLEFCRNLGLENVLVTCDDDNPGSIRTIERCNGVLENKVTTPGVVVKRRYWINISRSE